jgi:hypothetical protein
MIYPEERDGWMDRERELFHEYIYGMDPQKVCWGSANHRPYVSNMWLRFHRPTNPVV